MAKHVLNNSRPGGHAPKRVGQADVAEACGVSRTAVAFALNPALKSRLNPDTQRRIKSTAEKLGYRPHRGAQALRGVRSGILGVVQFNVGIGIGAQRAHAIASAIHDAGYQMFVSNTVWNNENISASFDQMIDAQVEGIILISPPLGFGNSDLKAVRLADLPVVSISGIEIDGVPQVRSDTKQGMRDLTSHLLLSGRRRLGLLVAPDSLSRKRSTGWAAHERVGGFRQAIEEHGGVFRDQFSGSIENLSTPEGVIVPATLTDDVSDPYQIGKAAMEKLIADHQPCDGLLCSNDDWALGALAAASEGGIDVPGQMAITGFDDASYAKYGLLPLTTVAQPLDEMARLAVNSLINLTRGAVVADADQRISLRCQLKIRQSCGSRT